MYSISDVYKDIVLNNDTMIHFPAKNIYAQAIIFNTSFMLSSSSFPIFIPHALKTQKFCKVKPIHRNHVFGMTVFLSISNYGKRQGLICHDEKVAYLTFEGRKETKKDSKNNFFAEKMKKVG